MTWAEVYELTRFELPVKPIEYGGQIMAMCPKCNKAQQVQKGTIHKCSVCGMLFKVVGIAEVDSNYENYRASLSPEIAK